MNRYDVEQRRVLVQLRLLVAGVIDDVQRVRQPFLYL